MPRENRTPRRDSTPRGASTPRRDSTARRDSTPRRDGRQRRDGRPRRDGTTRRANVSALDAAPLLTTEEVASLLRVHPKHVYRLLKKGLPARRVGSEWRFERGEVLA